MLQTAVTSSSIVSTESDHTLYAGWQANTHTITASAGTGGSISPSGTIEVNHGSTQTYTIATNSGYGISDVLVDGISVGAVTSYTFEGISSAHTISVSFVLVEDTSFGYTGGVQTYTVPVTGIYKLETWGAGGSNFSSWTGGAGGYSIGYALLEKGTNIYICVGGSISNPSGSYSDGGYNGGGAAKVYYGTPGGGATHMATVTGTLQEIGEAKISKILIVAGGGGGAAGGNAGAGGGLTGGKTNGATGGTQSSGGTSTTYAAASFGKGQDATSDYSVNGGGTGNGGGGGGGLYGGGAGGSYGGNAMPGAGGSGYIDGVPEFEYGGTTYTPSTTAGGGAAANTNGSAKISFIAVAECEGSLIETEFDYTNRIQTYTVSQKGIYKLEVWGAGGTSIGSSGVGGKGGYSMGYTLLESGNTIYVCVGGKSTDGITGGYNGGGSVTSGYSAGAGAGATHIATASGTLSSLGYSNLSKILIVAGGGGGAGSGAESGGAGGGTSGSGTNGATGGSQTVGGTSTHYSAASFGQGRNADSTYSINGGFSSCGGAGGGGLYGGGAGGSYGGNAMGGAGGSGYIGGVPEFAYDEVTYTPTTSNDGLSANTNGYAKITLIKVIE